MNNGINLCIEEWNPTFTGDHIFLLVPLLKDIPTMSKETQVVIREPFISDFDLRPLTVFHLQSSSHIFKGRRKRNDLNFLFRRGYKILVGFPFEGKDFSFLKKNKKNQ